jgi:hypothetical protein
MDKMKKSEFLKKFQDLETNCVLKHGKIIIESCKEIPVIMIFVVLID